MITNPMVTIPQISKEQKEPALLQAARADRPLRGRLLLLLLLSACHVTQSPGQPEIRPDVQEEIQLNESEWAGVGVVKKQPAWQSWHADEPYSLSVEKYVYVTCPPSLQGAGDFLTTRLIQRQGDNAALDIIITRETAQLLRMKFKGAKQEVVTSRKYWELVFIELSVTQSAQTLDTQIQMQDELRNIPDHWLELREELARRDVYDLSAVVSGRFKAGGMPASESGYTDDFEASNLTAELQDYASRILQDVQDFFSTKIQTTYDASTGRPTASRSFYAQRTTCL